MYESNAPIHVHLFLSIVRLIEICMRIKNCAQYNMYESNAPIHVHLFLSIVRLIEICMRIKNCAQYNMYESNYVWLQKVNQDVNI